MKREGIVKGYGMECLSALSALGWKYIAKNMLMCHPADQGPVTLMEEKGASKIAGLRRR